MMNPKHDNTRKNYVNYALKCSDNHVIKSKYCMLSASTSRTHVFLASKSSSIIESGASAHVIGTPSILFSLTPTMTINLYLLPKIIHAFKVCGLTKLTPSFILHNVLYVWGFPINVLSLSDITWTINYVAIFYPLH